MPAGRPPRRLARCNHYLPSSDSASVFRGDVVLLDRQPDSLVGIARLHLADMNRDLADPVDLPFGKRLHRLTRHYTTPALSRDVPSAESVPTRSRVKGRVFSDD